MNVAWTGCNFCLRIGCLCAEAHKGSFTATSGQILLDNVAARSELYSRPSGQERPRRAAAGGPGHVPK